MAPKPKKLSTAELSEVDIIIAIKDWLQVKEPTWRFDVSRIGSYSGKNFRTLHIGTNDELFGWIDGPYKNALSVLIWGGGAGHEIVDLTVPDSFEKIQAFMAERAKVKVKHG